MLASSLGHAPYQAAVGRVLEVGEGVSDRERWLGRLVVLPRLRSCGGCVACRRGHAALCARQEAATDRALRVELPARLAVPLSAPGSEAPLGALPEPADPLTLAALGDVGLAAYAAVIRASVEPNRSAIVLGRGPLARFVSALVEHRGAQAIRVLDPAAPLERNEALITGALAERTGEPFAIPLIDATGLPATRPLALALARPGSAVVLCAAAAGMSPPEAPGALDLIVARELSVFGLLGAHPDLLPELVAFVCKGRIDLAPLCRFVDDAEATALPLAPGRAPDEQVLLWRRSASVPHPR